MFDIKRIKFADEGIGFGEKLKERGDNHVTSGTHGTIEIQCICHSDSGENQIELNGWDSEMIDFTRLKSSAETVVDIDDGNAGCTGVEHGE